MNRRIGAGLLAFALPLSLVACGSDSSTSTAASTTTTAAAAAFPVTVRGVTLAAEPTHIVSLTPTGTETLFAIGAGSQVVAADKNSNYPADAPKTDLDAYQPNVEAIAAKAPDLVVASNDSGDMVAELKKLGIPVILLPAPTTLDEAYAEMADLGKATGHQAAATQLVTKVKGQISDVVARVGSDGKGLTYYYELDPTYYSATSKTFIGQVVGLLGMTNIADSAQSKTSDYPQLSAEYVVQQDPDLILLADTKCCQQDAAAVAKRQGWSGMKAVTGGGVVALDDDIASRWGPRISTLLAAVAKGVAKVKAAK